MLWGCQMQPAAVAMLTSPLPPGAYLAAASLFTTAVGVGWGISWVTWASDYSGFVRRSVSSAAVFWYSYVGVFVPTVLRVTISANELPSSWERRLRPGVRKR